MHLDHRILLVIVLPVNQPNHGTRSTSGHPATSIEPLLEAIPGYVFVVDADVRVLAHNAAAASLLGLRGQDVLRQRGGELLHCVHAVATPGGCGAAAFCRDCLIRSSVQQALAGAKCVRRRFRMELLSGGSRRPLYVLLSASALPSAGSPAVLLILEDVADLMHLHFPLSFCLQCKRVQDVHHTWKEVDAYLQRQMDLLLTHAYCPECEAQQAELAGLRARLARLTRREYEVFSLVIRGRLNKQIAAGLGTAEKTIKIHRSRVMTKMGAGSVAELVHFAERLGLLGKAKARGVTAD